MPVSAPLALSLAAALLASALVPVAAVAQTALACAHAAPLRPAGGKKTFKAPPSLRCPAGTGPLELEGVSAEVAVVQSPRPATKVTLNWDFVKKHREVRGAVMLDVFAGATLLKSCKALDLGEDWSAQASGSDSGECELPAEDFGRIDRLVIRGDGAFR
jgi:hypothetical protein